MSAILILMVSSFLTPVTESGILFSSGRTIYLEREMYNSLCRIDLPQFGIAPIASGTKKKGLNSIEVAPNSKMLLVTWFETGVGYSMEVMGFDGQVLKRFEGVASAVFIDDGGERMAIARGKYTYGERTESLGVAIYDFGTDKEEKILDTGLDLEWGSFDNSLYIGSGGEEAPAFRYDLSTGEVTNITLSAGRFSPDGKLRCGMKNGKYKIFRSDSQEILSDKFPMFAAIPHDTPVWMGNAIVKLPHGSGEPEEHLFFVETGKMLKAPGRILSVTDDEQFVYICKPGLVLEKVAVQDLEVLHDGNSKDTGSEEGE